MNVCFDCLILFSPLKALRKISNRQSDSPFVFIWLTHRLHMGLFNHFACQRHGLKYIYSSCSEHVYSIWQTLLTRAPCIYHSYIPEQMRVKGLAQKAISDRWAVLGFELMTVQSVAHHLNPWATSATKGLCNHLTQLSLTYYMTVQSELLTYYLWECYCSWVQTHQNNL